MENAVEQAEETYKEGLDYIQENLSQEYQTKDSYFMEETILPWRHDVRQQVKDRTYYPCWRTSVDWHSKKQTIVALNTAEAMYVAMSQASHSHQENGLAPLK